MEDELATKPSPKAETDQPLLKIKFFHQEAKLRKQKPYKIDIRDCCKVGGCTAKISTLDDEDKETLKTKLFKGDSIIKTKNKLISHLSYQKNLGLQTHQFNYKGHFLCAEALSTETDIRRSVFLRVLADFKRGVHQYQHGNTGSSKISSSTASFISWMKYFVQKYSQSSPDEANLHILSYWLTKKEMYEMYLNETTAPHVALSTFYQYFKLYFGPYRVDRSLPQVRVSKYSSHSVCDQCIALNQALRIAKTEEERDIVKRAKIAHRDIFSQARMKMEELKQISLQFPEDSITVQIDGMDNSKSYCPRTLEKAKKDAKLMNLPTKIQGAIIYSGKYEKNRKVVFYLNHDQYEQASNMVVTVVMKLIETFVEDFGTLPRKLNVFADNCWRENKNRFVLSFLESLVRLDVFMEVTMNFLVVGHTGNEVDQLFSILGELSKTKRRFWT